MKPPSLNGVQAVSPWKQAKYGNLTGSTLVCFSGFSPSDPPNQSINHAQVDVHCCCAPGRRVAGFCACRADPYPSGVRVQRFDRLVRRGYVLGRRVPTLQGPWTDHVQDAVQCPGNALPGAVDHVRHFFVLVGRIGQRSRCCLHRKLGPLGFGPEWIGRSTRLGHPCRVLDPTQERQIKHDPDCQLQAPKITSKTPLETSISSQDHGMFLCKMD